MHKVLTKNKPKGNPRTVLISSKRSTQIHESTMPPCDTLSHIICLMDTIEWETAESQGLGQAADVCYSSGSSLPTQTPAEVTRNCCSHRESTEGASYSSRKGKFRPQVQYLSLEKNPSLVTLNLFTLVTQCQRWGTICFPPFPCSMPGRKERRGHSDTRTSFLAHALIFQMHLQTVLKT